MYEGESGQPTVEIVNTWWVFAGFGSLFVLYGIYAFALPSADPTHWTDNMNASRDASEYIAGIFRWLGILSVSFGLTTIGISYGGFRRAQRWAWFAFLWFPFFFVLAIIFTWPGLLWLPLLAASLLGLWVPYRTIFRRPSLGQETAS